jgi:hypothetical protein
MPELTTEQIQQIENVVHIYELYSRVENPKEEIPTKEIEKIYAIAKSLKITGIENKNISDLLFRIFNQYIQHFDSLIKNSKNLDELLSLRDKFTVISLPASALKILQQTLEKQIIELEKNKELDEQVTYLLSQINLNAPIRELKNKYITIHISMDPEDDETLKAVNSKALEIIRASIANAEIKTIEDIENNKEQVGILPQISKWLQKISSLRKEISKTIDMMLLNDEYLQLLVATYNYAIAACAQQVYNIIVAENKKPNQGEMNNICILFITHLQTENLDVTSSFDTEDTEKNMYGTLLSYATILLILSNALQNQINIKAPTKYLEVEITKLLTGYNFISNHATDEFKEIINLDHLWNDIVATIFTLIKRDFNHLNESELAPKIKFMEEIQNYLGPDYKEGLDISLKMYQEYIPSLTLEKLNALYNKFTAIVGEPNTNTPSANRAILQEYNAQLLSLVDKAIYDRQHKTLGF